LFTLIAGRTGKSRLRRRKHLAKQKNPASRRDFPALARVKTRLAVSLLAWTALLPLTVGILLLLAGLLTATLLLLPGLLARILTRLTRILIRVLVHIGHSGDSLVE
jgi:hypothetical protein